MPLDSDVANADAHLHVEFYVYDKAPYKDVPFVRIMVPGDKTNIIEQPVREHHKERFIRQWLYFQSQNDDGQVIGTKLDQWNKDKPEDFNEHQMAELQILKFQTVEQVATATDSQLQRIGMGAPGLRERARGYLTQRNQSESSTELAKTRSELDELKAQMASLMSQRKPGRPRKEDVDVHYDDAPIGATGHQ
jgi:hypothetical protein